MTRRTKFPDDVPVSPQRGPEFCEAWRAWIRYRAAKRYSNSNRCLNRHLAVLAPLSDAAAVATVRKSIERKWQGLFPPKDELAPLREWLAGMMERSRRAFPDRKPDPAMPVGSYDPPHKWMDERFVLASLKAFAAKEGSDIPVPSWPWLPPDGWLWKKWLWHFATKVESAAKRVFLPNLREG